MANRRVEPGMKRIFFGITVPEYLKEKVRDKAKNVDLSMSEWVENVIKEKLDENK